MTGLLTLCLLCFCRSSWGFTVSPTPQQSRWCVLCALSWVHRPLACCASCRASWTCDCAARPSRVDVAAQLLHVSLGTDLPVALFWRCVGAGGEPSGSGGAQQGEQPALCCSRAACTAAAMQVPAAPACLYLLFIVQKGCTGQRQSAPACLPARSCVCGTAATIAASWSHCASPSGQRGRRASPRMPAEAAAVAAPAALCRLRPAARRRRRTLGEQLGPAGWHAISCHQLSSAAQLMPLGDGVHV